MQIIKKKKPGEKGYEEYIAKSSLLIFSIVFGIGILIILGTAIYLRVTMY